MKNILLFLFCLLFVGLISQNGFTTYTTNLSLPGAVKFQTAFLVDNNSNKWIGFRSAGASASVGLVKYDNINWTLYNTLSTPALPSNSVTALAKDNAGNIWIGTDVGLVKFNGSTFINYTTVDGLASNTITCIESVGNQLYVGTKSGLTRYDGTTFTNYNVANGALPNDTINCIKAENATLLWLGGNNRIIEFNINGTFTTSSYTNLNITENPGLINCIYIDNQNSKWLGCTNTGIIKYDGSVFKNVNSLYDIFGSQVPNKVSSITSGFHNGVLFAHFFGGHGTAGLTELTPSGKVFQYFYHTANYSFGVFLEREGSSVLISQGGPLSGQQYVSPKMYYSFNDSNYIMPINPISSDNFKNLDINNIKAGIANRGDMHHDIGATQSAAYEVPKGSGKNSNYGSALWIGGLDNSNLLHFAGHTYRQTGIDYWPGPLDTTNATIDSATCRAYNKIWKVNYIDINNFITAFNTGSIVATEDMLTWPAHGTGNNSRNLAPFVDRNGDGIYNPYDGDYPKIKGDQALYFIFNDNLAAHSNALSIPLGVEIQAMAYAYGCPNAIAGHNELTYSTFYDYKIINRSSTNYHDVFITMMNDVDIGYYQDDFIGCDVSNNYGFGYNGNSYDVENMAVPGYGNYMPAQGTKILRGPFADLFDGKDNNNNGTVDEFGEDCKLNKFMYFIGTLVFETGEPNNGAYYRKYMTGNWKDGTPLTCSGIGYGGSSINTNWAFPGDPNILGFNTDVENTCGYWTEISAGNIPHDRKMVLSSGPFTLNSGQMQEIEYAYVTSFDSSQANNNLISLAKLKTDMQKITSFYNQVNKPNCLQSITVGVTEVLTQSDFSLYPNPAKSLITLQSSIEGSVKINYEIVDVLGKTILQDQSHNNSFSVNVSDLTTGIYFIRLKINNSLVVKKFVKE